MSLFRESAPEGHRNTLLPANKQYLRNRYIRPFGQDPENLLHTLEDEDSIVLHAPQPPNR
jgi:hypothetical protein